MARNTSLLWEVHTAQQVGKARVVSQQVEPGIHPGRGHSVGTLAIGLLKPGKGLFLISQHGIQASDVKAADIAVTRLGLDLVEHSAGLVLPASKGVGSSDSGSDPGILSGPDRVICRGKRLF